VIALYQALDAALQLLRSDRSTATWELIVRAHVALAVGVPGHISAGEICAVISRAGEERPSMRGALIKLLRRWAGLMSGELQRELREMAALAVTSLAGEEGPALRRKVTSGAGNEKPGLYRDTLSRVLRRWAGLASGESQQDLSEMAALGSQYGCLNCSALSNAAAAAAALTSERLVSVAASPAVTSQFQVVEPVGGGMTPSAAGGAGGEYGGWAYGRDWTGGGVSGGVSGWVDGGETGWANGRPTSSFEPLFIRGLRFLSELAISFTHKSVHRLSQLLAYINLLPLDTAADLFSDLALQSFQASLRVGPIFGTRVALTHVSDIDLRVRLARFALAMQRRAAENSSSIDNGGFFQAQVRARGAGGGKNAMLVHPWLIPGLVRAGDAGARGRKWERYR
jgi:hypothetical protein